MRLGVRGPRVRRWSVAATALAASQLGHAITYLVRYGPGVTDAQGAGMHAYFPTLAMLVSAAVGAGLLAALMVVAAASVLAVSPPGYRRLKTVKTSDVLPIIFVVQLAVFIVQETIEAIASGAPVPGVADLLLWGTVGQLPAATVATVVICWLLARLEAAWNVLVTRCVAPLTPPVSADLGGAPRFEPCLGLALAVACPAAFAKRGPPLLPPSFAS